MRFAVPKAYVTVVAGADASAATALDILSYTRQRLAPYQRIRQLEFSEVPKTISGKIRRVELRSQETARLGAPGAAPPPADAGSAGPRGTLEFWEEDFPDLKG
jgi:acetyl-CoA synthetase